RSIQPVTHAIGFRPDPITFLEQHFATVRTEPFIFGTFYYSYNRICPVCRKNVWTDVPPACIIRSIAVHFDWRQYTVPGFQPIPFHQRSSGESAELGTQICSATTKNFGYFEAAGNSQIGAAT